MKPIEIRIFKEYNGQWKVEYKSSFTTKTWPWSKPEEHVSWYMVTRERWLTEGTTLADAIAKYVNNEIEAYNRENFKPNYQYMTITSPDFDKSQIPHVVGTRKEKENED